MTSGPDSTDAITFAKTSGAGTVIGLSTVTASGGMATDTITGGSTGAITIKASGTVNGNATSSGTLAFTVITGTASQIVLSGSTANLASGTTRTLTATIQDAAGNTVSSGPDSTDAITFAKTTGTGTLTGLSTATASAGVATDTVTGVLAGPVTLTASGTLNASATTSPTLTFTTVAGTATQLALSSGSGQSAGVGTAYANPARRPGHRCSR